MEMSKRELILRTLDHEETPVIPIHCLGFDKSGKSYQNFADSEEAENLWVQNSVGDITEQRFWHADTWIMGPFNPTLHPSLPEPEDMPNHRLSFNGSLSKVMRREDGTTYTYYVDGYFRTKERVYEYWDRFGRPSSHVNPNEDYSRQKWANYVNELSPYLFPIPGVAGNIWEATFEGMGLGRVSFYMRKDPAFIKEIMNEYGKMIISNIKGMGEAGVPICMMFDDLGQKGRTLLSLKNFREFVLPVYQKIYNAAKKCGMKFIQHSCGNITEFLPDMIDAGLNGIQALEPASGVNLPELKEKFGDKITFIGGIDSSVVMSFNPASEVVEEVKRCMRGSNFNYIAGASHNIIDVPWENILAYRNTLLKYRNYPLNI